MDTGVPTVLEITSVIDDAELEVGKFGGVTKDGCGLDGCMIGERLLEDEAGGGAGMLAKTVDGGTEESSNGIVEIEITVS